MSAILAVQVRLPLIRIEYVFVFQIWYCELCVKKPMRGRQETLFWFLFLFIIALPSARPLFLIVLHNGVKKVHVIKAWFVTWSERRWVNGRIPLYLWHIKPTQSCCNVLKYYFHDLRRLAGFWIRIWSFLLEIKEKNSFLFDMPFVNFTNT